MRIAALLLALALGGGLYRFASARPVVETRLPRLARDPIARANLALYLYGPSVRVSSIEGRHHPAYLIDGHPAPTETEKWASAIGDLAPWVELQLDRPHELDEVVLELAGARESAEATMRRYRVECFRGPSLLFALPVESNAAVRPRHPVRCPQADRVRIEFGIEVGTPRNIARVYELELWGR